jgi:hypothetical protein
MVHKHDYLMSMHVYFLTDRDWHPGLSITAIPIAPGKAQMLLLLIGMF